MLTNARITQNEEGYWLQVESKTASASLNLSIISKSELTSKALEEWAEEQTQAGLDIQTQIIHEMAYAMHLLGAQSDLLSTVGSYGQGDDEDVLRFLKEWNQLNASNKAVRPAESS